MKFYEIDLENLVNHFVYPFGVKVKILSFTTTQIKLFQRKLWIPKLFRN
jgi:hypothetical protein